MKTKIVLSALLLFAVSCLLSAVSCLAAVPSLINYQGVLKDSTGVPQNGEFAMKFCIYNDSTGGDSLWCEINMAVQVKNGLFNVLLGSVTPIPDSVFYEPETWLQVQVGGSVLSPRRRIASVGYAFTDGDWAIDGDNIYRQQGNVGIGTDMPTARLDVLGNGGTSLNIKDSGGNSLLSIQESGSVNFNITHGYDFQVKIPSTAVQNTDFKFISEVPGAWGVRIDVAGTEGERSALRVRSNNGSSELFWVGKNGNVGIGTATPAYRLDVEGYVQAYGYYTGDIVFQKDKEKLWRMFEDEDGLYLENLKTGKVYRFVLQEVEKE
jgi:hypothetical protein